MNKNQLEERLKHLKNILKANRTSIAMNLSKERISEIKNEIKYIKNRIQECE
jgi:predicted nucleotidyltransferase